MCPPVRPYAYFCVQSCVHLVASAFFHTPKSVPSSTRNYNTLIGALIRTCAESEWLSIPLLCSVFSPSKFQGMRGGHDLGGVHSHIKAFGFSPFPHQKKVCTEGLLGWHASSVLGRTLFYALAWWNTGLYVCMYMQEPNGFFVMTNLWKTCNQTQELCAEVSN